MCKPVILCNRPQSVVAATWCWQTLKKAPSSMKRQEKFQSYQMSQKEHQSWKVLLKCCHSQHFLRQDSCKNSRNTNKIISMASTRKPQNFSAIKHQKNIFRLSIREPCLMFLIFSSNHPLRMLKNQDAVKRGKYLTS